MPTYSYACTVCDHRFDIRQSFTDEPLKDCPVCFDASLRKVIHPVGISFKGSGFYKTDSRSSSSASGTSGSTGATGTTTTAGAASSGSSDSSPSSDSSSAPSTSSPATASSSAASTSGGSSTAP